MESKGPLKVLQQLVRKSVAECTADAGSGSSETRTNLQRFLSDPGTVDLTYETILERATTMPQSHQLQVLHMCVQLMLNNVSKFVPSERTLASLKRFCEVQLTSIKKLNAEDPAVSSLQKAITHLHMLVCRSEDTSVSSSDAASQEVRSRRRSTDLPSAVGTSSSTDDRVVSNILGTRRPQENVVSSRLDTTLLHSDQFAGIIRTDSGKVVQHKGKVLQLVDSSKTKERIWSVALLRKMEEMKLYRDTGQRTVRRKGGRTLFLYKYYREQVPLQLATSELDYIVNIVVHGSSEDPEARLLATKILIKVLMDSYCAEEECSAGDHILSLLLEMVVAPEGDTRLHAFNLLFNLSVHAHLLEDITCQKRSELVERVQEDLFEKLCEMLLCILHHEEMLDRVWSAALNLTLYFLSSHSHLCLQRLSKLDVRIIASFLARGGYGAVWGDEVFRQLIQMLVNLIYPKAKFDEAALAKIGGISVIIDYYINCRSREGRQNLFVVIYDHVITRLSHRNVTLNRGQISTLLEVLALFEAPTAFVRACKLLPNHFVENLVKFVFVEHLKKCPEYTELTARLDKTFVVAFLFEFQKTVNRHWQLEEEFENRLDDMFLHPENCAAHMAVLNSLLTSSLPSDKKNGECWLFSLLRAKFDGQEGPEDVDKAAQAALNNLLASHSPDTRRIYASISDKLILLHLNKQSDSSAHMRVGSSVMKILNDLLVRVVSAREKHEGILMYLLDTMMFLLALPHGAPSSQSTDVPLDTVYAMFMDGQVRIAESLLQNVSTSVLQHLFLNISSRTFPDARATTLVMLLHKCRVQKHALDEVGGPTFFKNVLSVDRDPAVIFHVSQFLLEHFITERPDEYKRHLNLLIADAQKTNDETVLENPYLQVQAFLTTTTPP